MGNPFFLIGSHLPTASWAFIELHPQKYTNNNKKRTISAGYTMLVLIFNAFREEDIYDIESCIRATLNFFNFLIISYLKEKL